MINNDGPAMIPLSNYTSAGLRLRSPPESELRVEGAGTRLVH